MERHYEQWELEKLLHEIADRIDGPKAPLKILAKEVRVLQRELEAAKAVINRQHDEARALVKAARQTVRGVPPDEAMVLLVDALKPFEQS